MPTLSRCRPLLLALAIHPAFADPPLQGVREATFAIAGEAGLFLPTDVTVASDGRVYVADGVNDRVVCFTSAGEPCGEFTVFAGRVLDRPLAVTWADDELYIADTGNQRVIIASSAGALISEVSTAGAVDITDVVPARDGTLWIVDNDAHQIVLLARDGSELQRLGARGVDLASFDYPYQLAASVSGELAITDVINGRVIVRNRDGQPRRSLSQYGVRTGELYRPKGVAFSADGAVWVTDSDLGVIQCFDVDGAFRGLLRDADGAPLKLQMPTGLAFDRAGSLYVVETSAHRVTKFRIERSDAQPAAPPPTPLVSQQARHCTACHIEWMRPLDRGESTELIAPPVSDPEHPYVSRAAVCLSCHDGSVTDSRRRVWREHGHQTGVQPSAGMVVAQLPLADGEIVCRTCHSAHSRAGVDDALADSVFLRVDGPPSDLCLACHQDYDDGRTAGMHPIGPMTIGTPEQLRWSSTYAVDRGVVCLTCHSGHGADRADLLVLAPEDNQLCTSCHVELTPDLFAIDNRSAHGRMPRLTQSQAAVADRFATRLGEDGELLCVTCHQTHDATAAAAILAWDQTRYDACLACHADQAAVAASMHDIAARHGGPLMHSDDVPTTSACAGCHTGHRYARTANRTELDPAGQCLTCHRDDGMPGATLLPALNHPQAACNDCHDPHQPGPRNWFLARPAEQSCRNCHADYAVQAPAHQLAHVAGGKDDPIGDACLACHRPHAHPRHGLHRVSGDPAKPGAACTGCHANAAPLASGATALQHPMALESAADGATPTKCSSCHEPHRGVTEYLLQPMARPGTTELCISCHPAKVNTTHVGHGAETLHAAGLEATACQPCHRTHAASEALGAHLQPLAQLEYPGAEEIPRASRDCLGCHRVDGPAPPPLVATHPDVIMFNPVDPNARGFLPLFNAAGEVDPDGAMACRTCHLTHGRGDPLPLTDARPTASERERRARQWHVRAFEGENICSICHGVDALARFGHFHEPSLREGRLGRGR